MFSIKEIKTMLSAHKDYNSLGYGNIDMTDIEIGAGGRSVGSEYALLSQRTRAWFPAPVLGSSPPPVASTPALWHLWLLQASIHTCGIYSQRHTCMKMIKNLQKKKILGSKDRAQCWSCAQEPRDWSLGLRIGRRTGGKRKWMLISSDTRRE